MANSPDFSSRTVLTLAARSAHICNNPECNTLTVGPVVSDQRFATKIGEAAHIRDARKLTIRWDSNMKDSERSDISNGIWLCASCHTMIDKNSGIDYPVQLLTSWKSEHEKIIEALFQSHQSPFPLLRKQAAEGKLAQDVADLLNSKGAFYEEYSYEHPQYVIDSLDDVRNKLRDYSALVLTDSQLKKIFNAISKECREYMNHTSTHPSHREIALLHMRQKIGVQLRRLESEYGVNISHPLSTIVP